MSPTNQEAENILAAATRLHASPGEIYGKIDPSAGSYFLDRKGLRLFDADIFEYAFASPVQLKEALARMWEYQGSGPMREFLSVCMVSAFKYRGKSDEPGPEKGISAFVYEF